MIIGLSFAEEVGKDFVEILVVSGAVNLLSRVQERLAGEHIRGYLVGGQVRDALLGRHTSDIDIAVDADGPDTARLVAGALGGRYVLLDEENRVARVVFPGDHGESSDPVWQLDISSFSGDIEPDLARRDFTINAMAVSLDRLVDSRGSLIDPFAGRKDLNRRIIRRVDDSSLEADAIRLLRAVRLAAELGFTIEEKTESQIRQNAGLIAGVAGERIHEELLRILVQPDGGRWVGYLENLDLLTVLIPELARLKGVEQPPEHHWDVFDHSLRTVAAVDFIIGEGDWEYADDDIRAAVPWSEELGCYFSRVVSAGSTGTSLLRLAALLHDVAKPVSKTIDDTGRMRFLGHAREGASLAAAILERLRFSTREVRLVETMVKHHLRPMQMSQGGLPTGRAIYRYFRDAGEAGVETLFLSMADHLATRGPSLNPDGWREHGQIVEHVLARYAEETSKPATVRLVDGHDIMKTFGLEPGAGLGKLLEAVREAQAAGEITTRTEALELIRNMIKRGE